MSDLPHPIVHPYTASVVMLLLSLTTGYNPQVQPWLLLSDAWKLMFAKPKEKKKKKKKKPQPSPPYFYPSVVLHWHCP